MGYYDDLLKVYPRRGKTADRPGTPPDKSAFFWDMEAGVLYGVNDNMEWIAVNPPDPTYVDTFTGSFNFSSYPFSNVFIAPGSGVFVTTMLIDIETAFDPGITVNLGDTGDIDRILPETKIRLSEETTYEYDLYRTVTLIQARLSAVSTFGTARVYLTFDHDPNN